MSCGICASNSVNASMPPADAPTPTIGKTAGGAVGPGSVAGTWSVVVLCRLRVIWHRFLPGLARTEKTSTK